MANFSQKFLKDIKEKLESEQERLTHELDQITTKKAHGDEDRTAFPNLGDKDDESAAEVAVYSDNLTIEKELENALRDVKTSLKRLEKGDYGTCKYCSKSIDERRLLARPVSSACVDCKKLLTQEA